MMPRPSTNIRPGLRRASAALLTAAIVAFTAAPASAQQPTTVPVIDDTDRVVTFGDTKGAQQNVLELLSARKDGKKGGKDAKKSGKEGKSNSDALGGGGILGDTDTSSGSDASTEPDSEAGPGDTSGLGGAGGAGDLFSQLGNRKSSEEETAGVFASLLEAIGIGRAATGVDRFRADLFAQDLAPKAQLFNEQYSTLAEALAAQLQLGGKRLEEVKLQSPNLEAILPANAGVDFSQYTTFAEKIQKVFNQGGIDAKVLEASAIYASQLDGLTMPKLTMKDTRGELSVPEESLMYGLVLDRSLAGVVGSAGILEQFEKEGFGSEKFLAEWDSAIRKGASEVGKELTSTLGSPCHAAFMLSMASGIGEARLRGLDGDCGACVIAGAFSRNEMNRLLDPNYDSEFFDFRDNIPTSPEFKRQPKVIQQLIGSLYPNQAEKLDTPRSRNLNLDTMQKCAGSSAKTRQALDSTMPNVMDILVNKAKGNSTGKTQLPSIGSTSSALSEISVMDLLKKKAGK